LGDRLKQVDQEVRTMLGGKRKLWAIGGAALVAAVLAGSAGAVIATGGDDDQPLTGETLDKATQAALEHTGGGTVVETEAGDDGTAYGVEVRLDDGSVVEVNLDEDFNVIGEEVDDDGSEGEEGPDEDD
jgi:hypothetical protein